MMNAQNFFDAMRFFGEPNIPENSDSATILAAYLRGLGHYPSEVLELAADMMLAQRKHRNFPLLAECLQFCRGAQEELAVRAQREAGKDGRSVEKPSADPWSPFRVKQADRMMASEVGKQAAKEGWIISLHDFCREQGRLPGRFEADKVRAAALAVKAERDRLNRSFDGNLKTLKLLASVSNAMAAKANRLEEIASGNSA